MNFDPDAKQQLWVKKMQMLCDRTIGPTAEEVDDERFIPRENFRALVENGFSGLAISEKYEGAGERFTTGVLVGQVLAKTCPSTYFAFLSHAWRVGPTIEHFGDESIKSHFLPSVATGRMQGGWALAEKGGGSPTFISTIATDQDGHYIINGVKSFVTGASAADFFIVIARIDKEDGPLAAFLVEPRIPCVKRSNRIETVGLRGAHVADLILEDCHIPGDSLLAVGEDCERLLQFARIQSAIGIATLGAGIIAACLELSMERATTRKRGGQKLGKYQEVHFKIAEMRTALDAVSQITLRAAYAQDLADTDAYALAATAKVEAAESATKAADDAMQIFGGAGYICGSPAERYWRDARFLKVAGEPIEATRRRIADMELAKYR